MAKVSFDYFLGLFPEVELPVTLSDNLHHTFSQENKPLNPQVIEAFITKYEATEADEFTEYIACFRLPKQEAFSGIVYWKAGLMNYDYVVATYAKTGVMIDKKAVAGTKVVGNDVKLIVATIDDALNITVAEGVEREGELYDSKSTKARRFNILPTGHIEQEY